MAATSRDAIFAALRAAAPAAARSPARPARPEPPRYPVESLRESLEAAGGRLAEIASPSPDALATAIPGLREARHLWSALPRLPSRGAAAEARKAIDLAELDFTLLGAELAVAENGAVWHVPTSPLERAAALLAEHLVVVVQSDAVVGNLHDAYARIASFEAPFGWFLSGPSKTADIEQSLVLGAHGPRHMTLLLARSPD